MSHLMTCVDAPNCTRTDLAMSTLAGVSGAKPWEGYIGQSIEDSYKKKVLGRTSSSSSSRKTHPTTVGNRAARAGVYLNEPETGDD